jgi:hypothetical protein
MPVYIPIATTNHRWHSMVPQIATTISKGYSAFIFRIDIANHQFSTKPSDKICKINQWTIEYKLIFRLFSHPEECPQNYKEITSFMLHYLIPRELWRTLNLFYISYCGIFVQSKNVGARERAVAREQLWKTIRFLTKVVKQAIKRLPLLGNRFLKRKNKRLLLRNG